MLSVHNLHNQQTDKHTSKHINKATKVNDYDHTKTKGVSCLFSTIVTRAQVAFYSRMSFFTQILLFKNFLACFLHYICSTYL